MSVNCLEYKKSFSIILGDDTFIIKMYENNIYECISEFIFIIPNTTCHILLTGEQLF